MMSTTSEQPDSPSSEETRLKAAENVKDEANKLFQAGKYQEACDKYSEAISLNPNMPTYYTNRSFAYLKMEIYGYAIRDADSAIKLDPSFIKAYYRRASANMALFKVKEALKDLRTVVKYAPNDKDAKSKLAQAEKISKKLDFERALAFDDHSPPLSETLNYKDVILESTYDGMLWDDECPLTIEWVTDMIERFKSQKKIHRKYALKIILLVSKIFKSYPSLVDVSIPKSQTADTQLTICGDVHGQFYDLINIFKINGYPSPDHAYLFNGDFVDRGSFSAEVILTLFAFKLLYPNSFFMSRGNHETDNMNQVYGFEGEIKEKYGEKTFKLFSEVFTYIPLGNVVEKRLFIVHGGLFSRDDVTLDELRKIERFRQPPNEGLMCEMLWSDPMPENGRSLSKRGVGLQFGPDVTATFLNNNNLDMVIRSHEVKDEGYVIEHNGKCVTVFSAPNYCDQVGNKGAYLNVKRRAGEPLEKERPELEITYHKFEAVPHPPVKPMQYGNPYGGVFGF